MTTKENDMDDNDARAGAPAAAGRTRGLCPDRRDVTPRHLRAGGYSYLGIGVAFLGVATLGHQPAFVGVGSAFLGLGIAFLANAWRRRR